MRRVKRFAIMLCAFAGYLAVFVHPALPQTVQSVAAVTRQSICVVLADGGNGTTSGTGFVVADGFVLTANHVVQRADHLRVLCPDHPAIEVTLARADADNDVALLHNPLLSIRPLPLGDSANAQVGQAIVVIGFPRADLIGGGTPTVTQGIVSAVRAGAVQIQAPMGPGNSGSPVLILQGQVIGVVRAVLGSQAGSNFATSFATAIDAVKPFLTSALGNPPQSRRDPSPVSPAPIPPPGSSNFVIAPGQGIGDVRLGMHPQELEALLGPAKQVFPNRPDGGTGMYWFQATGAARGYWVELRAGEVIMVAVLHDARYSVQGLHVGSSESDVRTALGEPSRVMTAGQPTTAMASAKLLFYASLGLRFGIMDNRSSALYGLVSEIAIYRTNHP